MMIRFSQLLLAATLCISLTAQNADVTTNLLAYFTDLLAQNTLDDDNLRKLIACAKEQKTCNPIDACEADISTVHNVAFGVIKSLLEDDIDSGRVLAWAKKNLKFQEETRKEQKQTRVDTKSLAGNIKHASLALGNDCSCAIKGNGGVICWGHQWEEVPGNLSNTIHISVGSNHVCALQENEKVICWGYKFDGQTDVPAEAFKVQTITSGYWHTCALLFSGPVTCWGDSLFGQSDVPPGLDEATNIAAMGSTTCALLYSGDVTCWGSRAHRTALTKNLRPENVEVLRLIHSCSLSKNGKVACQEFNTRGRCNVPEDLPEAKEIALSDYHTCAVLADGSVQCWGHNDKGQTDVPEGLRVRLPSSGSTP